MPNKKINAKNGGTVRQRPDGRWESRAVVGGKRRSFYGDRQSDALKAMRAALKAVDDGIIFRTVKADCLSVA
ncbi:MAG: hypothetical protein HFE63_03850 [Clostridiales bacterium]|nr:hypothetical protein [Clostridiales bacterium]